jgi:hypothetical protein
MRTELRGAATLRRRRDTVEVWHGGRLAGVFDRATFARWIAAPRDWLASDDVLFVGTPGFVGIAIRHELGVGALSSDVVMTLRGLL